MKEASATAKASYMVLDDVAMNVDGNDGPLQGLAVDIEDGMLKAKVTDTDYVMDADAMAVSTA